MEEKADLVYRLIWPYIQEIVSQVLSEKGNLEEATVESLTELVCYRAEMTVRRMVKELNEKARGGELGQLRALIRENPELARKASKYVSTRLKWRVRRLIKIELEKRNGSSLKALDAETGGGKKRCAAGRT